MQNRSQNRSKKRAKVVIIAERFLKNYDPGPFALLDRFFLISIDFGGPWGRPRDLKSEDLLYEMHTFMRGLGRLLEAPWSVFGALKGRAQGRKSGDLLYGIAVLRKCIFKKKIEKE